MTVAKKRGVGLITTHVYLSIANKLPKPDLEAWSFTLSLFPFQCFQEVTNIYEKPKLRVISPRFYSNIQ